MQKKAKTYHWQLESSAEIFHKKAAKINVENNNGDDGADIISDVASVASHRSLMSPSLLSSRSQR